MLKANRNYRFTWSGQVVSEVGDNFNNIAVFSLALANTGSGLVVAGILMSRGLLVILAGPVAGVLLDRLDRKRIMIASDLVRAVIAVLFLFAIPQGRTWLLFLLSGLLMFASPFFTSGRASILPTIATKDELHTANSLTQLTQWTTVDHRLFSRRRFGELFRIPHRVPVQCIVVLVFRRVYFAAPLGPRRRISRGAVCCRRKIKIARPWHEYVEGLRYMRSSPLILGIGLVAVGWATGGGAAQILFSLFGEQVFHRGPSGIGVIWGCAGIGLICGALFANAIGRKIRFETYKRVISICYVIHGAAYVLFSQAPTFGLALFFIGFHAARWP